MLLKQIINNSSNLIVSFQATTCWLKNMDAHIATLVQNYNYSPISDSISISWNIKFIFLKNLIYHKDLTIAICIFVASNIKYSSLSIFLSRNFLFLCQSLLFFFHYFLCCWYFLFHQLQLIQLWFFVFISIFYCLYVYSIIIVLILSISYQIYHFQLYTYYSYVVMVYQFFS